MASLENVLQLPRMGIVTMQFTENRSSKASVSINGVLGETRRSYEAKFLAAVDAADMQSMVLAWCDLVAVCFHSQEFSRSSVLCQGSELIQREFDQVPLDLKARAAVAGYAASPIVGSDSTTLDFWELKAFEHVRRDDDDALWLALGISAFGVALWLGRSADRLRQALTRIEDAARRLPDAAQGWWFVRRQCGPIYTDDALELSDVVDDDRGGAARSEEAAASVAFVRDLTQGRIDAAQEYVYRASASATSLRLYDQWLLLFFKCWLHVEADNIETASHDAAQACAVAVQLDLSYALGWSAYAMARTLVPTMEIGSFGRQLAQARISARKAGNELLLGLCRLTAALRAIHLGRHTVARPLARAGLQRLQTSGAFRPPLLTRGDLQHLIDCLISDDGTTIPRLQELYAKRMPSSHRQDRHSVEIRCLGNFVIHRDGESLHWNRKPPRRPIALLKALIATGPEGALVDRLSDSLWPGLEADRARKAMSTALYRLRGILGEGVVVLDAGRLRLSKESVWVDLHAFEMAAGRSASVEEAIALYNGSFLPDESESWVLSARHRAAELYRSLVCSQGERMIAVGDWQAALTLYRTALAHDSLAEVFYRGAISACRSGGLRAEASALYERCREELAEKLGLNPSAQTMALYASAIRLDGTLDSR